LLVEQVRLAEEAEAAGRAEWEQLNRWVQEVERRVDGIGGQGDDLRRELETEHRRADDLARTADADRRSWDARRESLEAEIARLRATLAEAVRNPDAADLAMLETLEIENRRLRDEHERLARTAASPAEVESLREQLDAGRGELEKARQELRQALDDRQRERKEYEAELASLRSQAARESLKSQEEQVKVAVSAAVSAADAVPSVDDRIKALRLHLLDIHEREETERARKSLSARLSRLWHHTSPQR
jgi:chromosome segregation ATPase